MKLKNRLIIGFLIIAIVPMLMMTAVTVGFEMCIRDRDIWDTFRDMIHLAVREQPDCLFVCGDLFHRQPLKRELKEVDYLFSLIPDTRVFLMAGNHDFAGEGSAYRRFSWSPNVFFFSQEKLSAVSLELSQETARRSGIRHLTVYGLSLIHICQAHRCSPYQ